jgi:FixJ family two-component response regulator
MIMIQSSSPPGSPDARVAGSADRDQTALVYIVDADEAVRQSLARLLDAAGIASRACASLESFLHEVRPGSQVCALIDVSPPARPTAALLERLRRLATEVPIIALSANDAEEARRFARELGSTAYFRKPVDAGALLDAIDWVARPH